MHEFSWAQVKQYDLDHGTDFLGEMRKVVDGHAINNRGLGPFCQLRTDWTTQGVVFALTQTLRYVDFGYENALIFRDLGAVVWQIFTVMLASEEEA